MSPGEAPFIDRGGARDISDPLPQAMVLTAIVITLGLTAFLLTMAYRVLAERSRRGRADDVEEADHPSSTPRPTELLE